MFTLVAFIKRSFFILLLVTSILAEQTVSLRVSAARSSVPEKPLWNYFGYDEPNFTYAPNGRKLIRELAALSPVPVHIRTHFLLATGNGKPALKWGSTNVYTEDSEGRPLYNWKIVDRILGTYVDAGVIPFVEIGFMPQALSTHPLPYQPVWKPHGRNSDYFIGWTYPPNDYRKWTELVYQLVRHCIATYGQPRVSAWDWEVWNEPNIGYWHGSPSEYDKLYDFTVDAVKRALPSAHVGGPASTGPDDPKAAEFLEQFLEHCASGKNAVTGSLGAPLDFISYHAKGHPQVVQGHLRMGVAQELRDAWEGFHIVRSFPHFRDLPVILSEADPEGCAGCSSRVYPPNAYRNGPLYAVYEAAALKAIKRLASQDHINLEGILTWAFEFEDQPFFDGFRALATNGIDKPVLNFFRMAGHLRGAPARVESSGAIAAVHMTESGAITQSDVDALASHTAHSFTVLAWNYRGDPDTAGPVHVALSLNGLPDRTSRLLLHHYRIDQTHSNAYATWKKMGSPQSPPQAQYIQLEKAGQLQLLEPVSSVIAERGSAAVQFDLPAESLSCLDFTW